MSSTPHLALPLIAAAQAQKHVTHNEALLGLDALVHLAVIRRDLALPPASPEAGDRYIVGPNAVGAWAGQTGRVAVWEDGRWRLHAPRRGWLAYLLDERALVAWTGAAWAPALAALAEIELARLGVGTAPAAATPFAAKLNQALFTARAAAEGGTGDLRLVLNKEAVPGTASLLFQSAYAGRAEIGLAGDDDLRLKVSADGQAWTEALRVERATGRVSFPAGAAWPAPWRNRLINGAFTVNQRGHASGAALAPGAYAHDRWRAGPGGAAYAFAHDPAGTTVTLTSGTLRQAVEPALVEGGAYTLSWAGTAVARLGAGGAPGGAFAASPPTLAGVGAGQGITVEFGPGTLGQAQLEPGPAVTPFEGRPATIETLLCQRYYWASAPGVPSGANSISTIAITDFALAGSIRFPVPMRATPAVSVVHGVPGQVRASASGGAVALNPTYAFGLTPAGFSLLVGASVLVAGQFYDFDVVASAEL